MDLSQLRSYLVQNVSGLVELDFSNQDLASLPSEVFQCAKIQLLQVSRNRLQELPRTISALRQLQVLQASHNFLTAIPETIVNCTSLTELVLEKNRLSCLPTNLGLLSNLKIMKLGENDLETLTNEIGFLENLRFLDIHGNKLWHLPVSIGNLHKLRHLNLACNKFEHLPMPVCQLRSLVILNIHGNQLISLAPAFDNLKKLKELNLSGNRFKLLPSTICYMKDLQYLNVASNQLSELPAQLSSLSKLQVLHAQQNYLQALPEEFHGLQYLNVAHNNLLNFSVCGMKKLKYLNAMNNQLENTPMAMFNLSKLEHLKLSGNKIVFLSQDIILLKHLKTLDLGNNRLTSLPQVINELEYLNYFNVKGNHISQRLQHFNKEEGRRAADVRFGKNSSQRWHHLTMEDGLSSRVADRLPGGLGQHRQHKGHQRDKQFNTIGAGEALRKGKALSLHVGQARQKTVGQRAGMWTQEELLQDGFSQTFLQADGNSVMTGANVEAAEVSLPRHYLRDNHQWDNQDHRDNQDHLDKGRPPTTDNTQHHENCEQPLSRHDTIRSQHRFSDMPDTRKSLHRQDTMRSERKACNIEEANNFETDLKKKSTSMESLSSTDFKLLGVCSQLEAMLNEELLHPVLSHPGSLSNSFKKSHIMQTPKGLWKTSQKDDIPQPEQHGGQESEQSNGYMYQHPFPESSSPQPGNHGNIHFLHETNRQTELPHPEYNSHQSSNHGDLHFHLQTHEQTKLHVPACNGLIQPIWSRSKIDRYLVSHQGRVCVSSVDPNVTILVPRNETTRPVNIMMQIERISENTLNEGRKDHELIDNIISMGAMLHVTTTDKIHCKNMAAMTIPMPPGGKKGKFQLLSVRGDNSCIPCSCGYQVKNNYLTLQTWNLSGKVAVYTRSKCKYKACKSVEQLLQFHYI